MVSRIKTEGLNNSQVMEILGQLTDVFGPRLTGTPGIMKASEWSRDKMTEWGLVNAAVEPWGEFGQGWELNHFSIAMTKPYYSPIIAYPEAWTPSTDGEIRGTPVLVAVSDPDDLEQFKGKLRGAIVLIGSSREAETHFEPDAVRRSDEDLKQLAMAPEPGARSPYAARRAEYRRMRNVRRAVSKFLQEEGVGIVLKASRGEHGTLFVGGGGSRNPDDPPSPPSAVMAVEHHLRLTRLLEKGLEPELAIEVKTTFHKEDLTAYNVVAEIPGTDPMLKEQLVMLGGHIDSWHAATGAADNAAGVAVSMEAVRILKALGVEPRRTIRVGLWSAEEQGLLGARGYVTKHFGDRRTMELKPDHSKVSGYFNYDNGTGKIRGIYLQGNDAVRPIFEAWLRPFHDLGAKTITIRNTGGTDHLAFDAVGLPGFQFIQDQIDYSTRIHHTNMDLYDHALAGDLMQSSVIMASFVYHTAMREEMLPRKALPEPSGGDRDFVSLFDGATLDGWKRHEGLPGDNVGGKWIVEDGAIVGDQDPPGQGGFLITEGKYKNFRLRLETKLDYPVDSGIFLRVGEDGKSHQVTLDNRPEGDIGGIYLPWTQESVLENPKGVEHLKKGEWNRIEIEIRGEPARIRFWLNDELVTDYQHTVETTKGVPESGYIALQIHPGESWEEGKKARFRNIEIQAFD
jgi:hypothetical protein